MIIMILFLIIIAQAGCVHADPSFQFSYPAICLLFHQPDQIGQPPAM